ncbi:MAG: hypothetical protein J6038_00340 [Bacilli bacterium]|nr:hypothetical protein [Bacilli bacterium]
MGGLLFLIGVACIIACISDASFNKTMRQTTIFAEAGYRKYLRKYREVVLNAVDKALAATGYNWRYSIKFCKSSMKGCKFNIDVYAGLNATGMNFNAQAESVKDRIFDILNEQHAIKQRYSVSVNLDVVRQRY